MTRVKPVVVKDVRYRNGTNTVHKSVIKVAVMCDFLAGWRGGKWLKTVKRAGVHEIFVESLLDII